MSEPALVTIAIVAYNNWPDLEIAIQSALRQTYPVIEVIVIDNSSTDETPVEVPKRFGNRVRYVRQPNVFDRGAYNTGIRLATGTFIQFLDGDDLLAPNKIEKQMEVFQSDSTVDIVYGEVRNFQSHTGIPHWHNWKTTAHDDVLMALLDPEGFTAGLWVGNVLFRLKSFEKTGLWDEALHNSDWEYYIRAAWLGCRFRFCPGSVFFSQRRPGDMTSDVAAVLGMEDVWEKALAYVTREPYRGMIAKNLSRLRFDLAIAKDLLYYSEALSKLKLTRTGPYSISPLAYTLGYLLISMPGGRKLAWSAWLRFIRKVIARLLGMK